MVFSYKSRDLLVELVISSILITYCGIVFFNIPKKRIILFLNRIR